MARIALTRVAPLVLTALMFASCGDDDDSTGGASDEASETTVAADPTTTVPPTETDGSTDTTTTAPPEATTTTSADGSEADIEVPDYGQIVATLASDELGGRDNLTDFGEASREALVDQLSPFAQPLDGATDDRAAYFAPFAEGVNVLALIPGTDLADEYVVVGAHYDHLGSDCLSLDEADTICNGATDNAAGVAAALQIGRSIAAGTEAPRRSIILAFWDSEEDNLLGSAAFVAAPPRPLESIVGYVNFDIQGSNLSPALANITIMVGSETGGPSLVAAATAATAASTLDTVDLSLLFGQGRSDHAVFAGVGVPSVFFTDANGPCYHTTGDDLSVVDFDKLAQQIATGEALTRDLMNTDTPPAFDPAAPVATYDDAVAINEVLLAVEPDLGLFPDGVVTFYDGFRTELGAIVGAGAEAFDDTATATLLGGSVQLVDALTQSDCDGFLD